MSSFADHMEAAPGHEESHPRSTSFLSGTKRRSKPEIYFIILSLIAEKPTPLLELSVGTRMNFAAAKRALGFLISKGLVSRIVVDGHVCYDRDSEGS